MTAPGNRKREKHPLTKWRITLVRCGLYAVVTVLVVQAAHLQVVEGRTYYDKAVSNRLRSIPLHGQRGTIYAGDGTTILAKNRAACDLFVVPNELEGREDEVCALLEELVRVDGEALRDEIGRYRGRREFFRQILVKEDISRTELTAVEEMAYRLPGVFTVTRPQRTYPLGKVGGQLMGFINEISDKELKEDPSYAMGDRIGRMGLEESYEPVLRGRDGQMVVSVYSMGEPQIRTDPLGNPMLVSDGDARFTRDQRGRRVTVEMRDEPSPGRPIHTTLDVGLQRTCEALLEAEHARGAIVVLNANTGAVLAMASVPGYDPNVFVSEEGRRERAGLLANRDGMNRMRHRAFMEQYPPGSVFKVMMAVAALEEGVIDEGSTEFCPGHFSLGGARWRCWKRGGHGSVGVVDALAFSCDVFFYNVGLELGIERIDAWGRRMGLGVLTGLDLPGEVEGVMPSPEWKMANYTHLNVYDRQWQKGDTVNLAIGQGMCSLTPLQTTVMMACIVNGGRRVTPYLNADRPAPVSEPFISPRTLEIVQAGMRKCVAKHDFPSGTGRRADIEGYTVIGKTGTAQTVPLSWVEGMSDEEIPYNLRDHAWFVAGVLDQDPPIAITVLYERGQHGSSAAAPLARDVILAFYEGKTVESPLQVARTGEDD